MLKMLTELGVFGDELLIFEQKEYHPEGSFSATSYTVEQFPGLDGKTFSHAQIQELEAICLILPFPYSLIELQHYDD